MLQKYTTDSSHVPRFEPKYDKQRHISTRISD
jgi:hypothetical protein